MPSNVYDRRKFLKLVGAAGFVPLIGTANSLGRSLPAFAESIKGPANSVIIPTHEWAGDINERLDFPADWQIEVMEMKGANAPPLDELQIGQRLDQPIGTLPLEGVVAGRRRIVITFDDLTRPTPMYTVMPWIMGELRAAGVPDENVLLMGAFGSHRAMTQSEVEMKLGRDAATRFAWQNHNVFENVKEVGTTSLKNRIKLNQTFLAGDCKITISGVKGHEQAGLSGGAKAVLPGVAGLDTIQYNHWTILPRTKTAGVFKVSHNEVRRDMIEAARMANVNFSVQIVMNQHRQPVGVFAGDIVYAHEAAARMAVKHYVTPTTRDADIVVANAYPVNNQAFRAQWWFDPSLRQGGTGVLIVQHPLGSEAVHWLNARITGQGGHTYFDLVDHSKKSRLRRGTAMIVYSQYLTRNMINSYPPEVRFASRWDDVIQMLREKYPGQRRVAIYPYAGLQEPDFTPDI